MAGPHLWATAVILLHQCGAIDILELERRRPLQIEIEDAAKRGVRVFAPLPTKETDAESWRRKKEGPGVRAWRERMETAEGRETYKERPGTAECVNAIARNRGLRNFLVRGIPKYLAVLTLFVLAHNVMRAVALLGPGACNGQDPRPLAELPDRRRLRGPDLPSDARTKTGVAKPAPRAVLRGRTAEGP